MAGFGTGRLVNCGVWKGGEIGQGLDLAKILAWLLDLCPATGLGSSRGDWVSLGRLVFMALEAFYHTYR